MNNDRRKTLRALNERIQEIQTAIESTLEELQNVRDEEQEAFDNLPESFQAGERGEAMEAAINEMDTAIGELEGIDFTAIADALETAAN